MANEKLRVGIALGGGFARGLAHIGVLEVFEREGIPLDMIAGTSIGALVGALYAREHDASLIRKQAMRMDILGVSSLVDLALPKSGFIAGRRVTNLLKRLIGDIQFKDLDISLACVATDIISGDEVVLTEGSVLEAVRASISIPVVFTVIKKQNRFLVDGGLVNPVPVSVVKQMGADFVVAVDVTPDKTERANYLAKMAKHEVKEPGMIQVMIQAIYISSYLSAHSATKGADVVVHPSVVQIAPGEFHRAAESILEGELAAVDAIPHIKKQLAEAGIPLKKKIEIQAAG
jgi:NTE family protein